MYGDRETYEVEFVTDDGKTVVVVPLKPGDIGRVASGEILDARRNSV